MAVVLSSQLATLVQEFAPKKISEVVNQSAPILDSGALKQFDAKGREVSVYVMANGHSGTQWIADNGTLPTGASKVAARGSVLPANVVATMAIGRTAGSMQVPVAEAASMFMSELKRVSRDIARHVGRGIFSSSGAVPSAVTSGTWSGTAIGSTNSYTFPDVSIFKIGAVYELIKATDTVTGATYRVECTDIALTSNVAGLVSFAVVDQALGSTAAGTGDRFQLRGVHGVIGAVGSSELDMVSLVDICGSSSLHGVSTAGWVGNADATGGTYSQEAVLGFMQRIFSVSGEDVTHVIMPPNLAAVHAVAAGASAALGGASFAASRKVLDGKMDKYGQGISGLFCAGKPVIVDPNCPSGNVFLHNDEAVKLAWFKRISPDSESGDPMLLGRSTFSNECQISGALNLVAYQRNAVGRLSGFTAG